MKIAGRPALQVLLFAPLVLALSLLHSYVTWRASSLADLFHSPTLRLASVFVSPVVAGACGALLFAHPFLWLYRRHAILASSLAALLAAAWMSPLIGHAPARPFVMTALAWDTVCLAALPPFGVWVIRRLRPDGSFKADACRDASLQD